MKNQFINYMNNHFNGNVQTGGAYSHRMAVSAVSKKLRNPRWCSRSLMNDHYIFSLYIVVCTVEIWRGGKATHQSPLGSLNHPVQESVLSTYITGWHGSNKSSSNVQEMKRIPIPSKIHLLGFHYKAAVMSYRAVIPSQYFCNKHDCELYLYESLSIFS